MPATDNPLDLLGDRRVEEYSLTVRGQRFILRFQPVVFFEHYSVDQLFELVHQRVYEVSFARVYPRANGRFIADFDTTGGGNPFQVLGTVAHAILGWAKEKRLDYLYWWTLNPARQRVYAAMIRYFAARGSGWRRLTEDPFTGLRCRPETFWVVPDPSTKAPSNGR